VAACPPNSPIRRRLRPRTPVNYAP
jgi:hypothetical protein